MMSSMHPFRSNTFGLPEDGVLFPRAGAGVSEHARTKEPEQCVGESNRWSAESREHYIIGHENSQHHVDETRSRSTRVLIARSCISADIVASRFRLSCERVLRFLFELDLREADLRLVLIDGCLEFRFVFGTEFEGADDVFEDLSDAAPEDLFEDGHGLRDLRDAAAFGNHHVLAGFV